MKITATKATLLLATLFMLTGNARAQNVDCTTPMVQMEMNYCAGLEYKAADKELNRYWKTIPREIRGKKSALLKAQRLWIKFRDAQCVAEADVYRGGSIAPMIHAHCMARMTRTRIRELGYWDMER